MVWYFIFFFVSGLCGIVYELVWLRLAMAQFGVTTALTSIVLSMFMGGLGLGSWAAGAFVRAYGDRLRIHPLKLYGLTELLIGCSALGVPLQLSYGHRLLENMAAQTTVSSAAFYLVSGAWLALTLVPWCTCMGATIPVMMFAIRAESGEDSRRSFSFLYLANVGGAIAGAVVAPLLVELSGFHAALEVVACLNAAIAVGAFGLALISGRSVRRRVVADASMPTVGAGRSRTPLLLLFLTGLTTMGMEVIWIRLFTPYVGPVVYAFATILAAYLFATFVGSRIYRRWSSRGGRESGLAWIALVPLGMLPLVASDVRLSVGSTGRVLLGVMAFSGVMGFVTPMLVDRWSEGDPDRAGKAYGINVLGCIVGPLLSGFLLLPFMGERWSTLVLTLPWLGMTVHAAFRAKSGLLTRASASVAAVAVMTIFFFTEDFGTQFAKREVLRDSTATVIATGEGMSKRLVINGVNITAMVPITKMMAHLSLASLAQPPRNALVICFGMGTTFRSAMSWGIPVTAVDLVPSVPKLFGYYHRDAAEIMASPRAHVVIDDGRRFLERSPEEYDAIIIDPPPPVQAAGSSLLYSEDFYAVAKKRLRPGGILQQFLPDGISDANDNELKASMAQALQNSFAYVRMFRWNGRQGWHFLASAQPIPVRSAEELANRTPAAAVVDMLEWGPAKTPDKQFDILLSREMKPEQFTALSPQTPALQDDRPINEYYVIRRRSRQYHDFLKRYF
ncbi:MAG: fused MFS/spermidine synthase [Terriglobales bacterium]